jgi:signal recognition particle GTPase
VDVNRLLKQFDQTGKMMRMATMQQGKQKVGKKR